MKVLVINCGSSSLKFQLIDSDTEQVLAKGLCERIGIDGRLTYSPAGGGTHVFEDPLPNHTVAAGAPLQFPGISLSETVQGKRWRKS